MTSGRRSYEDVTINLTPMIDVVFLLVIFFMVGSRYSDGRSQVDVSIASPSQLNAISRVPQKRQISILANGDILLDGRGGSIEQIIGDLRQQLAAYPALQVGIHSDGDAPHKYVQSLLDQLNSIGVRDLGMSASAGSNRGMRR